MIFLFAEFDDFKTADAAVVDGEADECADFLPSVIAGSAGIDMEQTELAVRHDFKDVGVAADHYVDSVGGKEVFDSGGIFPGIAGYVGEPYPQTLDFENFRFTASAAHVAVVDIAAHGTHHRRSVLKPSDNVDVADIAGMPDFVAVLEMDGIAVVPA